MNIAIVGAGAWGTALAACFSAQHRVSLWETQPEARAHLAATRTSRFLPEIRLPETIRIASEPGRALDGCDLVLIVTPTSGLEETARAIAAIDEAPSVLWACKGFVRETGKLAHEVIAANLPRARRTGVLSGPSFALEVARGLPTALVLASRDAAFAAEAAAALNTPRLRIYSSRDVLGVELGGALKNVIALAAGISDGLALGFNARAALITRGLAEMARLGVAMGGQAETFNGLAGMGDLVLTCTGELSRNRTVGVRLAEGASLERILAELGHVAEGVNSARAARDHARAHAIEMPITEAVCAVLFEGRDAREAVRQLLTREPRPE